MSTPLQVLLVEDCESDAELLVRELRRGGYVPMFERVETAPAMRAALTRQEWELVIADYSLPQFSGPAALSLLQEQGIDLPFIIVSGSIGEESAVAVMKLGAEDFIGKGKLARLVPAVERGLREASERRARRQAELALQVSEQRFRSLIENAPSLITLLDPTGDIRYQSPSIQHILGYRSEEWVGKNLAAFVHPGDSSILAGFLAEASRQPGGLLPAEFRVQHRDGAWRVLEVTGRNLVEDLRVRGIVVNAHDITDTRRAEEQIRELLDDLQRANSELTRAYDTTLEGWSRALDLRDRETEGHSQRVTEMTLRLAQAMGMKQVELLQIRRGALLHDIGKMGIPDSILRKASVLNEEEWDTMRRHPVYAYELLSPITFLQQALDIPYCHHEKWDGTGYPRRLKGDQIPLAARIFAVVDVWDALRSDRPYRPGWSESRAREHIRSLAGTHFDPYVVEVFLHSDVTAGQEEYPGTTCSRQAPANIANLAPES